MKPTGDPYENYHERPGAAEPERGTSRPAAGWGGFVLRRVLHHPLRAGTSRAPGLLQLDLNEGPHHEQFQRSHYFPSRPIDTQAPSVF